MGNGEWGSGNGEVGRGGYFGDAASSRVGIVSGLYYTRLFLTQRHRAKEAAERNNGFRNR